MRFVRSAVRVMAFVVAAVVLPLTVGWTWEHFGSQADAEGFLPPGTRVALRDGRKLHLLCTGNAAGPIVVLEMGLGEPSPYWWAIQTEVAKFARTCSYDRAGYGFSDPDTGPVTLESRAADLDALLVASGTPGPYVLVGHSLGGPLVRLFARDHADRVAGLVFVDTMDETVVFSDAFGGYLGGTMAKVLKFSSYARRFGVYRAYAAIAGRAPFAPQTATDATLRALAAGRPMYEAALAEHAALMNAPAKLRQLHGFGGPLGDTPVAVIMHGVPYPPPFDVAEKGFPESQKRLAALSSNSVTIRAMHSNHAVQEDEPEVVVDAIRRVFLAARDHTRLAPN